MCPQCKYFVSECGFTFGSKIVNKIDPVDRFHIIFIV